MVNLAEIWNVENLAKNGMTGKLAQNSLSLPFNIETIREHHKNIKNVELSFIPSNWLEIASYGLSIPKMDS